MTYGERQIHQLLRQPKQGTNARAGEIVATDCDDVQVCVGEPRAAVDHFTKVLPGEDLARLKHEIEDSIRLQAFVAVAIATDLPFEKLPGLWRHLNQHVILLFQDWHKMLQQIEAKLRGSGMVRLEMAEIDQYQFPPFL